jgi:uncharacterized MAPEG superfamily protein
MTNNPKEGVVATRDYTQGRARRLTTETKTFYKTSEFWTFVALALMILIAGNSIEGQEGGSDFFAADKVWLYITILGVGYLLSRGIAKSGVRGPYWDEPHTGAGDEHSPIADRVKAAAKVLTDGPEALEHDQGVGNAGRFERSPGGGAFESAPVGSDDRTTRL